MTLRLRNTLTRTVEPVSPIEPGRVRMYSCGPTVYRFAHVGNLRTFLLADLVRRALLLHGVAVFHVQNITDVGHLRDELAERGEDRMLIAAGLEGRSPAEIAASYEAAFHEDEAELNILPAHLFPRATEHIREMIHLAERLEDRGIAYRSATGNLYYSVASFPGYGQLSGNTLDELRAGHRGEVEPDKRDPADFALWKTAAEGRLLKWPAPRWGDGFPGWHLECSAMSMRHLGEEFDIHTGGVDNVFPHHEDEIAQTAPLTGRPPARMWVHGAHLLMRGRRMAKSAGNFLRVIELAAEGLDPLAFRYLALSTRYASRLHFSDSSIRSAAAGLASLRARLRDLGPAPPDGPWAAPPPLRAGAAGPRPQGVAAGAAGHGSIPNGPAFPLIDRAHAPTAPLSEAGRALHERLVGAIDENLDLPIALALARQVLRSLLAPDEKRWLVLDADLVFGLDLDLVWRATGAPVAWPVEVATLVAERSAARRARDFALADAIREQLAVLGWEVSDRSDGTSDARPMDRDRTAGRPVSG